MNKSITSAGAVLALLLASLVGIRYIQGSSVSNADASITSSMSSSDKAKENDSVPENVSSLPDIEYVPLFPGASFLRVEDESTAMRLIAYQVDDNIEEVASFYDKMLHERGWIVRGLRGYTFLLTWTDPNGNSPWHLWLRLVIGPTRDETGADKTLVNLDYGRYPDTDEGLPIYTDARSVEVTHALREVQIADQAMPAVITDVTYLTNATPDRIADFYNSSAPQYGWFFYDPSNLEPQVRQSGNIDSARGITFTSSHDGLSLETTITDYLTITSTKQDDGQLLIKLHIEEIEVKNPNY